MRSKNYIIADCECNMEPDKFFLKKSQKPLIILIEHRDNKLNITCTMSSLKVINIICINVVVLEAWIKLVNLPFECWSEYRVSVIVNGFGRYLRCDDNSRNMLDLIGFKCQIAVEDISDIPENLANHIRQYRYTCYSFGGENNPFRRR